MLPSEIMLMSIIATASINQIHAKIWHNMLFFYFWKLCWWLWSFNALDAMVISDLSPDTFDQTKEITVLPMWIMLISKI